MWINHVKMLILRITALIFSNNNLLYVNFPLKSV